MHENFNLSGTVAVIIWAGSEEILKFLAFYFTAFRKKYLDEPIDAVIYLIATALGFAALENAFFITCSLSSDTVIASLVMLDLRFVGATLLHIVSSASIGIAIALSFYKQAWIRRLYLFTGLLLAILLHSFFNLSIIESGGDGRKTFAIFSLIWLGIILLLLLFEKIKTIYPINRYYGKK